jgi:hypothetical protein
MTLNASGPISLAGTTAGQSIQIELGGTGTTQISLNDTAVRNLAGVPSGAITMPTNFYGKSNRVSASITISSNVANYTLNTSAVSGYVAGKTDVTLTINSGVYVYSNSTGSYAFTVASGWTSGDTITLVNNGTIVGRGGNGGNAVGSDCSSQAGSGGSGGPGLLVNYATKLNNGSGRIAGGGGGGGASNAFRNAKSGAGGGGGGGGIGNSSGGCASGTGGNCTPCSGSSGSGSAGGGGSLTSAGGGGNSYFGLTGSGGSGGSYGAGGGVGATGSNQFGQTGGNGGSGGASIAGNSNITYISAGTINGSIS